MTATMTLAEAICEIAAHIEDGDGSAVPGWDSAEATLRQARQAGDPLAIAAQEALDVLREAVDITKSPHGFSRLDQYLTHVSYSSLPATERRGAALADMARDQRRATAALDELERLAGYQRAQKLRLRT